MSMAGTFKYAKNEPAVPMPDSNVFHRYGATFPWRSQATWHITQMLRWGQIERPLDIRGTAKAALRTDIYRSTAQELGIPYPTIDDKTEGSHKTDWTLNQATASIRMGPDWFFDGRHYDPAHLVLMNRELLRRSAVVIHTAD